MYTESKKKPVYHKKCFDTISYCSVKTDRRKGVRSEAFDEIVKYIDRQVIKQKHCKMYQSVRIMFQKEMERICKDRNVEVPDYCYHSDLLEKIRKHYKNTTKICSMDGIKVLGPLGHLISCLIDETLTSDDIAFQTAKEFRSQASNVPVKKLTSNHRTSDIIARECLRLPEQIYKLFLNLLGGPKAKRRDSLKIQSLAKFLTEDKVKTSKHITVGMLLKNLIAKRQVIDIASKLGISCR